MAERLLSIGIVGGTGKEGSGLALRWASAGYNVSIGGRFAAKAQDVAKELNSMLGSDVIQGGCNADVAREADIVVLTVPFAAQLATALPLKADLLGKILVDVTVPLVLPKVARVHLPVAGSAALQLQAAMGDRVKVVSAFQNVSAHHLRNMKHVLDCDVLVSGDDVDAREIVVQMAKAASLRAYHAGPLANSVVAEALTSVLIAINQRYKVPAAGIRITGIDTLPP